MYVNDISESLLSLTRLFADDSSLFCSASSIQDIEGILNHDLQLINVWSKTWLVNFNPNKTEAIMFSLRNVENPPQLVFQNVDINFVEYHKHLGITLGSNGSWSNHIDNILASASKTIAIMKKMKYNLSRRALNQIYLSYVRPILEYSCIVWDGCTEQCSEKLEKLQNEAARIVTGLTKSVSLAKLYQECGWDSLADRRQYQKLCFMFKANHDMVPSYVLDLIPPLIGNTNPYPLRNSQDISAPYSRTSISMKSFVPSGINLWNNLDDNFKNLETLQSFKHALKISRGKQKVPTYFYSGKRQLQVLHATLRNNCSNLENDLFLNHLSDSNLCSCSIEIEDAEHYFFKCRNFVNQRIALFASTRKFHPLSLEKLLYGSNNLCDNDNNELFHSVQLFFRDTKRFTD